MYFTFKISTLIYIFHIIILWLTIVNVSSSVEFFEFKNLWDYNTQDDVGKQKLYLPGDSCGIFAGQTKTDGS